MMVSTPLGETLFEYAQRLGGVGTLNERDLGEFQEATKRVGKLLGDGAWHSATEIYEVTGQRDGMRRLRELRQVGYKVERARISEQKREWWYRLASEAA